MSARGDSERVPPRLVATNAILSFQCGNTEILRMHFNAVKLESNELLRSSYPGRLPRRTTGLPDSCPQVIWTAQQLIAFMGINIFYGD